MKLRVGYKEIDLVPMDPIHARLTGHLGEYRSGEGTILVHAHQTPFELADTVIHELLHAIVDERDLHDVLGDREEPVVRALAHGLTALFRDNPDFAKAWLSTVKGRKARALLATP
jgi:hypothetical protein